MRALHIDLAPRSAWQELRRARSSEWLLLAVGLAMCMGTAWKWWADELIISALQADLARANTRLAERKAAVVVAPATLVPEQRVAAVSNLIDQLNAPWSRMFVALERADQPSSAVLDLTVQPKQRRLRGAAEARDTAAMIQFIERLQSQPVFESARLVRHDHAEQDSSQPVRFEFEVSWVPGASR